MLEIVVVIFFTGRPTLLGKPKSPPPHNTVHARHSTDATGWSGRRNTVCSTEKVIAHPTLRRPTDKNHRIHKFSEITSTDSTCDHVHNKYSLQACIWEQSKMLWTLMFGPFKNSPNISQNSLLRDTAQHQETSKNDDQTKTGWACECVTIKIYITMAIQPNIRQYKCKERT